MLRILSCGRRKPILCFRIPGSSFFSTRESNPYPYPANANPTPHQLFHLPSNASQNDVKARYYELVRIYHPDSPFSRPIPPEVRQGRFQAISTAYDVLRGKRSSMVTEDDLAVAKHPSPEMWKARRARRPELQFLISGDDRWKDWVILGSVVLALGVFTFQTLAMRRHVILDTFDRSQQQTKSRDAGSQFRDLDDSALAASTSDGSTRRSV